jgi:hypothetical protein
MNRTAILVLVTLGGVLVMFAVAAVVYPVHGLPVPEPVAKNMDALIVAFVAVLARTGKDEPPSSGS